MPTTPPNKISNEKSWLQCMYECAPSFSLMLSFIGSSLKRSLKRRGRDLFLLGRELTAAGHRSSLPLPFY